MDNLNTNSRWLVSILIVVWFVQIACGETEKDISREVSINTRGELTVHFSSSETSRSPYNFSKATFVFGMPKRAADKSWLEDGVLFLQWYQNSIIYTMTIFCSPIEEKDQSVDKSSIIVRLHGENTDSEYKEARAGFLMLTNGIRAEFEFLDGIVSIKEGNRNINIVAIEIPAGCHVVRKKDAFEFSGSMPPGTTGFMVFKIPLKADSDLATMSRLVNLDYEDCLNLFKKVVKSKDIPSWVKKDSIFYLSISK